MTPTTKLAHSSNVTLIRPTLAALAEDEAGEHLARCEICAAQLRAGDKIGAVEIEPGCTRDACATCAGELAVYVKGEIDVAAVVARARAALAQEQK